MLCNQARNKPALLQGAAESGCQGQHYCPFHHIFTVIVINWDKNTLTPPHPPSADRNCSVLNELRISGSVFAPLSFLCGGTLHPDRRFQVEENRGGRVSGARPPRAAARSAHAATAQRSAARPPRSDRPPADRSMSLQMQSEELVPACQENGKKQRKFNLISAWLQVH